MATVPHPALVGNAREAAGRRAPASTDVPVLNPLQRDVASVYARLVDVAEHTTRFCVWLDGAADRIRGVKKWDEEDDDYRPWVDYADDDFRGCPWLFRWVTEWVEPHLVVTGTKPAALTELDTTAYRFDPAAADADPDRVFVDVVAAADHLIDLLAAFAKRHAPPLLAERPGYGEPFGPHFLPKLVADAQGLASWLGHPTYVLRNEINDSAWELGWDRLEARLGIAPEVAGDAR